ncbi:hypothetical protein HPB50_023904 [Hyalomma asiaticum]|uniref:Uncharacterized protein n=1 Tax=Hyalomma asiaticum TaxID=266040 RepID=A0ACB7T187_HYAAI|nr:hypothetical protein HPB50_023904 [Hyalomma asiaticum]
MASQGTSQAHDHFPAARRDTPKQKQQKQPAAPDQSESGRNRCLVLVLSSCLVFSVAASGLLLAPLIARSYFHLESQPGALYADADDEQEPHGTPFVLDAPRFDQRYYRPQRSNVTPARFTAEVVPRPKNSIFCVLEARTVARDGAALTPYRFCSHVVVCCGAVDHSWLDVEGDSLSAAVAQLRASHPDVQRVLGIGGTSTNVTVLARAIEDRAKRARLVTNIVRTLSSLGYDWGSLVHVPRPEQLEGPQKLGYFVEALCRLAARASLHTAVLLPAEPEIEADVYESLRALNGSHYLTLIKMTHATGARYFTAGPPPCSIFNKLINTAGTENMDKNNASTSQQGLDLLVSLSAAAFEFASVAEKGTASEVSFRRIASRAELCGGTGKDWHVRRSDGCVVVSSGPMTRVAMDPQSHWGSWRKARGVVIFDMKLDDTRGKCGPPYSFTRSVYFALESHAGK